MCAIESTTNNSYLGDLRRCTAHSHTIYFDKDAIDDESCPICDANGKPRSVEEMASAKRERDLESDGDHGRPGCEKAGMRWL